MILLESRWLLLGKLPSRKNYANNLCGYLWMKERSEDWRPTLTLMSILNVSMLDHFNFITNTRVIRRNYTKLYDSMSHMLWTNTLCNMILKQMFHWGNPSWFKCFPSTDGSYFFPSQSSFDFTFLRTLFFPAVIRCWESFTIKLSDVEFSTFRKVILRLWTYKITRYSICFFEKKSHGLDIYSLYPSLCEKFSGLLFYSRCADTLRFGCIWDEVALTNKHKKFSEVKKKNILLHIE